MKHLRNFIKDHFVSSVLYEDSEKRIIASYLSIFLIVSIILLPIYVLIKILGEGFLPSSFINFGLAIVFIFLLYLVKKGRVILSGILFLIIGWIALTAMAWYADGVQDMAIVAYILLIFLATLFSGIRFAIFMTGMSIVSVWIFGFLQLHHILTPKGDMPLNYSRDYTIIFALVMAAIVLLSRSFRNSLKQVSRELKERIKVEEILSKNEQILIEKNIELIAAKDKAEESDRLKTAFIQNISHEIRTPMNGIVGFVELLQHTGIDSDKKAEYVGFINSCTRQLANLVSDLIDISRIESGSIDFIPSEMEASELVNDLNKSFIKSAEDKGLGFKIINELGSRLIKGDMDKIKQTIDNLVSNAVKFTPSGSIQIKLSKTGNSLEFSVTDTGIGVKESDKDIIFDRFRQSEVGLNRSFGGAGLGLAISKGIVEFMGGKIWFESTAGKGSTFAFLVPAEFPERSENLADRPFNVQFKKKLKILIAEDDEINFIYIKELLVTTDCSITWAKDGYEAVEIFRNTGGFDIILMDLKMPVMNGYEATREIRLINPEIPVIAVTAYSHQAELEKSAGVRFDNYVIKPIGKDELMLKISQVLA